MGIYKVIHIKLPKKLKNIKNIKKHIYFLKKRKKYKKKKQNKPLLKKNILKYLFIFLFSGLVLVKCVALKQIEPNKNQMVETKQNFWIKESLPY